jgi:hypothetical protein
LFILDLVEITGKVMIQPGAKIYNLEVYLGSSEPTYKIDDLWNGFNISKAMANQFLKDPPPRSTVRMT